MPRFRFLVANKEQGMPLQKVKDRAQDGSPILEDGEKLIHAEEDVAFFLNTEKAEGVGTLFITSLHVIWLSKEDKEKGYSMDFYFINIHAICHDTTNFPYPCIYAQLDSEENPEAYFVPKDPEHCTRLWCFTVRL